jgi:copper chaperone CopZ
MKPIILMAVVGLLSTNPSQAQIKNAKTETVKVNGDCGMCETTIEKVGNKKNQYKTDWDADTKLAIITYDSKKTGLDAILKNIALSGYDNISYLAPDEAYAKLPGCCQYKREKKAVAKTVTEPTIDATGSMPNHTGHTAMDMQQTNQLTAIFDNYFALKDALVKTDGATASAKASVMLTALDAVEMGKLKMEEHTVWMKIEKGLKTDAQHIKENKDTEHQREHFMSLSKSMYELIIVAKPAETVYYQFCPMANDGKGANWLSKESAIKNPYYGSQMLSCGKVVETIKQ